MQRASPPPRPRPYAPCLAPPLRVRYTGWQTCAVRITVGPTVTRTCAVCERTLLQGERATRFSPHGSGDDYVDVCPLCQELALEHWWVK